MTCNAFVFDAYGTLFDVHAATRKYADAIGPDHALVSDIWRQKQLEYTWIRTMTGRYMDFWDLTQQALDYAMEKVPSANKAARQDLLDAYWKLESFAEVKDVLTSLKAAGKRTGILSNGSSGMLDAAVKSAGLDDVLDDVISVDRIKIFKANSAVYQMVVDDYGCEPGDVSFQSSNRWDAAAATAFDFRAIWINRGNMPSEYNDMPPAMVLPDLTGLVVDGKPV